MESKADPKPDCSNCGAVFKLNGTSALLACKGNARKPNKTPKISTAVAKPTMAGNMNAFNEFSSRTRNPGQYGSRVRAASREMATRSRNGRSDGAFRRRVVDTNCCTCRNETYS